MKLPASPWLRWLLVPVMAVLAASAMAWVVRMAAQLMLSLFGPLPPGRSVDLLWNLVAVPGAESALLGFAFVMAGRWMAPMAKATTALVLARTIVGTFAFLTLAVWVLEPTALRPNLQASLGCIAAYVGARLAVNSDLR